MKPYDFTEYRGIDYGRGMSNVDHDTGIRFGVIPHHHVPYWYETSKPEYPEALCPKCGGPVTEIDEIEEEEIEGFTSYHKNQYDEYACLNCETLFSVDDVSPLEDPLYFYYDGEGYSASEPDDVAIFIAKSPYYTYCQFCSPCAPGAGYLPSPMTPAYGVRAYCFGHEWFDDGKAPYPVYDVKTGKVVKPKK